MQGEKTSRKGVTLKEAVLQVISCVSDYFCPLYLLFFMHRSRYHTEVSTDISNRLKLECFVFFFFLKRSDLNRREPQWQQNMGQKMQIHGSLIFTYTSSRGRIEFLGAGPFMHAGAWLWCCCSLRGKLWINFEVNILMDTWKKAGEGQPLIGAMNIPTPTPSLRH